VNTLTVSDRKPEEEKEKYIIKTENPKQTNKSDLSNTKKKKKKKHPAYLISSTTISPASPLLSLCSDPDSSPVPTPIGTPPALCVPLQM
jgi:hypothetical protein